MATLWLLLALAAGAAAINPLSSRCIYMMYPDVCAVLPIGLEDRWFPPKDFMSISFAVGCGYTLGPQGDAVIELDDITGDHSRKKKPNFGMEAIDTVIMNPFRLFESDVTVGAMEPGTQIFNVSLVAKHNNTVIDFMLFCAEIVPSDTAFKPTAPVPRDLDPTAPISGRPFQAYFPKPANSGPENLRDHAASDHLPVRVMYLGDLGRFDGMKRFMYMNMRYLDRKDVEVAYLDLTNGGMGVMGRLLLEAGVDIYQHSVSCPRELCESAADFYRFVLTLHQYDAFEQVPAPWQSVFKPVVDILKGFDAIVMVNDVHTDYYIAELARFANPRMARIADLTTRFRLHHESTGYPNSPPFDALFAPSYFVGRHPAVRAEGRPTYVTHGAVDTVEFDPERVQPAPICDKRAWSSPAGPTSGPVFGFIARLSMEKGPGMFLAAAQIVLATLPSARFVMVGRPNTPTYLEAIKQLARVYGVDKHLLIHTFVEPADMPSVFACLDVLVSPFTRPATETFGLVNIEANAMRVPFVHFGTGGIQDYAEDYVNSILAPLRTPEALAEAMLVLGRNETLRRQIGHTARELVLRHNSVEVVFKHNAKIFRRIVASRNMDVFMSMSAVVRVWEQPELDACTARLVMNPVSASDGIHMLVCEAQLQHPGIDVDGLQVSDGIVTSTVVDVLFLEVVLTLQPTAAPMRMGDIFGNDGVSFRQTAVELFLERHNKRSVVCVSVRDAAQAPGTRTLCTPGVGNTVIIDPNWDIPPFMSSMPEETVVTGLLWPRLRVRLCVTPEALGVRAVADLQRLYVSAWIRDRDDPTLVYAQVQ